MDTQSLRIANNSLIQNITAFQAAINRIDSLEKENINLRFLVSTYEARIQKT